jgi:trehalose synthase-fused probable maltokinase
MSLHAWLETELPRLLPAFLLNQRWFGGKARPIQIVDIEDAVWLPDSPHRCALTVVGVRYADGVRERYAMLLGFVDDHAGLPVVGRFEQSVSPMWVVEAATDAGAALALLQGFVSTQELRMLRGGSLRYGDTSEAAKCALAGTVEGGVVAAVGTEQSNTSLRLDRTLVFKLFRKLDTGENPELEVGRFLTTRTTFRAMPGLRGSLTYVSARGESSTLGVLQDWIESHGDGWTHVVALLREPSAETSGESLLRDLFALGVTTADFHAALATDTAEPAFAPEPVTAVDVQAWRALLLERAALTFRLVERNIHGWAPNERRLGEALLDLRARASALADTPELTRAGGFHKIRIHGDYHLGQILRTPGGFALIDFEGEPTRPLAERRLKHCALKDVAGMIRSFDYAVDAVRDQDSKAIDDATCPRRLRESFLDGYLTGAIAHHAAFFPRDRHTIDAWIDFFEVEKALYEVEYEINNRPAWVGIPLRAILRILRGQA